MNTDKNSAKNARATVRAFGYSVCRLRQTPRNANTLKVPRFFLCVLIKRFKVQWSNRKAK